MLDFSICIRSMVAIFIEQNVNLAKTNFVRPFTWNRLCFLIWHGNPLVRSPSTTQQQRNKMKREEKTLAGIFWWNENILIKIAWLRLFMSLTIFPRDKSKSTPRRMRIELLVLFSFSIFSNGYYWNLHLWAALRQSIFSVATEENFNQNSTFQHSTRVR